MEKQIIHCKNSYRNQLTYLRTKVEWMQFRSFICAFFRLFRDLITSCSYFFLIDILNWVTRINLLPPFLQLDRFLLNNSTKLSIVNETLILIIAEKK